MTADPTRPLPTSRGVPGWAGVILAGAALSIIGYLSGSARPGILETPDATYQDVGHSTADAFRLIGRPDEAFQHYEKVLAANPAHAGVLNNKAGLHFSLGHVEEAIKSYEACLRAQPDHGEALCNYGNALTSQGRLVEAAPHLEKGLALEPDHVPALVSLSWILAVSDDTQIRQPEKALQFAQKAAAALGDGKPPVMRSLAAALAANGRFEEASELARKAADVCDQLGDANSAGQMRAQADAYRAGMALHVSSLSPP